MGAPSLARSRVCSLQFLLGIASAAFLRSESQVSVVIAPRNKVAQLYPQALGSLFVVIHDSQSYGEGILTHDLLSYNLWLY
jgi:hypothetical protein